MPLSFANPEHLHHVLHLFKFFAAREDFTALVERASKPATPTFLSALRAAHPFWLQLRRFVLHLFKFFAAREDFTALVERASKHPFWLRLRRSVGQPILAAAGF
jgi:hypothetical protein